MNLGQLDKLLSKVEEAGKSIQFAANLVDSIRHEPSLYLKYNTEVQKMIEEYNEQVFCLQKAIEKYFKYEEDNKLPVNMTLRKAYRSLKFL